MAASGSGPTDRQRQPDRARTTRAAPALNREQAERLVQAAVGRQRGGDTGGAIALLEQALRLDPRHQMALARLATLAVERRDHASAITYPIFSVFSATYRNDYGKTLIYSRPSLESAM